MLTAILERSSWFIAKLGMPLVLAYHLLHTNVFLNTAAEDAQGLERWGNNVLAPTQYFFEGKIARPHVEDNLEHTYLLERRFDYENHFFMKTAASAVALPFSLFIGSTLKSIAYLTPETRERADRIYAAAHSKKVDSNLAYYRSIGMNIQNFKEAEMIDSPKWKRHPTHENQLAGDLEALKAISEILSAHQIPFWLDCGSCLGTYQYGGAIPNDWDIDIGILLNDFHNVKNALQDLDPEKFVVQDWSGRARPHSYLKVFVKETGGLIDLYHFQIDPENKTIFTLLSNEFNIFLPKSWIIREERYSTPMAFDEVFPLKKALFEGVEVPVPGQIAKYLQKFYGENLAPARVYSEISGNYEKDLSHPYWQLPHAH